MSKISKLRQYYSINRDSLSQFLPWRMYDEEFECFINFDNTFGWLWQLAPLPFAGDITVNAIQSLLRQEFPLGTTVQFILFADPRVKPILDSFLESKRDHFNPKEFFNLAVEEGLLTEENLPEILREMETSKEGLEEVIKRLGLLNSNQVQYIKAKLNNIGSIWAERYKNYLENHIYSGFSAKAPVPVRTFKLYLAISIPYSYKNYRYIQKKCQKFRNAAEGALTMARMASVRLGPRDLLDMLTFCFNPSWAIQHQEPAVYNPKQMLNEQIIRAETEITWQPRLTDALFKINQKSIGVYSVKQYPEEVSIDKNMFLIGDIFRQNLEQIFSPFILTLTFVNQDYKGKIMQRGNIILAQKSTGSMIFKLKKKQEEFAKALDLIEDGKQFKGFCLNLVTFNENEDKKNENEAIIYNLWKKQNFDIQSEILITIPSFLMSLPFGLVNHKLTRERLNRINPAPIDSIAELAPVQADWGGNGKPAFVFISRRGQIMGMDVFNSNTNYNCAVAAQTGAGKSFFVCYLIMCYYAMGAKIRIIDNGRSFQRIIELLDGDYLQFAQGKNICINPFTITHNINEDLPLLSNMIQKMAKPKEGCNDFETAAIDNAIRRAWEKYGPKATVSRVGEILRYEKDPHKQKLGELLAVFGPGGPYAPWFEGDANVAITDKQVQGLELEELNMDKRLRAIVLLFIMYQNSQLVYTSTRKTRKLIIIDEAWDLFGDESAGGTGEFIENAYRRARKYNGSIISITQSISDYYKNDTTEAMLQNSAFTFLLQQKESELKRLVAQNKLSFNDFLLQYCNSVHSLRGDYSEVFVQTDNDFGIGRLFVDPYTYALFTTEPTEVTYIEQLRQQGMSLDEALEKAAQKKSDGT